jgi:hypothetical protein
VHIVLFGDSPLPVPSFDYPCLGVTEIFVGYLEEVEGIDLPVDKLGKSKRYVLLSSRYFHSEEDPISHPFGPDDLFHSVWIGARP